MCWGSLTFLPHRKRRQDSLWWFSSYSSSVSSLLIASQFPFDFTYIVSGTSLFSRLLSKRRKKKNETRGQTLSEGRITTATRDRDMCFLELAGDRKRSGGILNVKCVCRTRIQGAKRTQLSSYTPSQRRTYWIVNQDFLLTYYKLIVIKKNIRGWKN